MAVGRGLEEITLQKGIECVVLERAEFVSTTGAAIGIYTNGWRALDQLGIATQLRHKAIPIKAKEELRCLKRSDLIQILADSLPLNTIRFGCHILAAKLDLLTSQPLLQLQDGSVIKSKVLIGCDGVNSVVSKLIGLKATRLFSSCGTSGFTSYPSGHGSSNEFIRMRRGNLLLGRMPVDDNLVYWFVGRPWTPSDSRVSKEPELIKRATVESIMDFPTEIVEMVKNSDLDSLTLTNLRYRAPWDILL
ncbi:hypothetical protein BVC80_8411g13 [Macleaya cordata]|uniref:Monooxygenase n=1 Tax=Macleaya cordata TaxID=56857 RepID=A0A200QYD5_MACCD|nr:hypothetical protein BVC80_8411g13 [Macleaya cordata]